MVLYNKHILPNIFIHKMLVNSILRATLLLVYNLMVMHLLNSTRVVVLLESTFQIVGNKLHLVCLELQHLNLQELSLGMMSGHSRMPATMKVNQDVTAIIENKGKVGMRKTIVTVKLPRSTVIVTINIIKNIKTVETLGNTKTTEIMPVREEMVASIETVMRIEIQIDENIKDTVRKRMIGHKTKDDLDQEKDSGEEVCLYIIMTWIDCY